MIRSIVLVALASLYSLKSFACDCMEIKPKDYLKNCEVLFTATLSASKLLSQSEFTTVEEGVFSKISHVIKGETTAGEYAIENTRDGTSCDSHLQIGKEYVVCVNPGKKLKLEGCGYTHPLYVGNADAFVKSLPKEQ